MKNNQDEFNLNSNSIFNSFDKLNIYESPITESLENYQYQYVPSNTLLPKHYRTQNRNYNRNQTKINDINNSFLKDINNLSQNQLEFPLTKEEYLNNLFNETKVIQNEINEKKTKLMKENAEIQQKKQKLIEVYYNLYEFRNKLLDKEKELNDKEYNLEEYENVLKNNEQILKNNIDNFDEYIKNKSNELKNQFEQIQKMQNQKEEELRKREEQLVKMIEMYSLNKDLNNINSNLNNLNQNESVPIEEYKLNNDNNMNKETIQNETNIDIPDLMINKSQEKNKNLNNIKINESIENKEFINFFNNYTLGNNNQNTEISNKDKKEELKESEIDKINLDELDSNIKTLLLNGNI